MRSACRSGLRRALRAGLARRCGAAVDLAPLARQGCWEGHPQLVPGAFVEAGGPRLRAFHAASKAEACQSGRPLASCHQQRRALLNLGNEDTAKHYKERRLIPYTAKQLYDVVASVENYKDFVPWCQKSKVTLRTPPSYMEAELEVGFKLFTERRAPAPKRWLTWNAADADVLNYQQLSSKQSVGLNNHLCGLRYTSQVSMEEPTKVVSRVSNSTLFNYLDTTWEFKPGPTPTTCWLSFSVDFAFKSPLYRHIASVFFDEVVKRMMSAFQGRCGQLYGPANAKSQQAKPAAKAFRVHPAHQMLG